MKHRVVFTPEAEKQLVALHHFVERQASATTAARFTEAIIACCENLRFFPLRGTRRDDIRPGLRTTHYKKRTVIVFHAADSQVSIIGIFYGGQNFEARLRSKASGRDAKR